MQVTAAQRMDQNQRHHHHSSSTRRLRISFACLYVVQASISSLPVTVRFVQIVAPRFVVFAADRLPTTFLQTR
eukprot:m.17184 g.17184  ORF g.17184 m.17184 type:complete len:73 (-) comp7356_c0_seq1:1389-1607(-)